MQCSYGQIKTSISEKHELTGIVWALAEAEEFKIGIYEPYYNDIKKYFEPYKNHPIFDYIKNTLRKEPYLIGYNGPVTACKYFEVNNGVVKRLENYQEIEKFDNRWTVQAFEKYTHLLNEFSKLSHFNEFYNANRSLYTTTANKMLVKAQHSLKPKWFEDFYGKKFPKLDITICLAYGNNNFSGKNDQGDITPVMGINNPQALDTTLHPVLIHEISHSFSTESFNVYMPEFKEIGKEIFPYFKEQISKAGYGPIELVYESLNEVFAIIYIRDELGYDVYEYVYMNNQKGFTWVEEMIKYCDYFLENRIIYKTIDDFMPSIVGAMNNLKNNIKNHICNTVPYVINTFPINGSVISSKITEIHITFSRDMDINYQATGTVDNVQYILDDNIDFNTISNADFNNLEYWKNNRTYVFKIIEPLVSDKIYGVRMLQDNTSREGVRLGEDFILTFKTK